MIPGGGETVLVDGMVTFPVLEETSLTTSTGDSTTIPKERERSPVAEQTHVDDITERSTIESSQPNQQVLSSISVHQSQEEDSKQQQQFSSQDPTTNVKKRRGPKPRPRDALGNIIRTPMITTRRNGGDAPHVKTTAEHEMSMNSSMKSPKMFMGEKEHDGGGGGGGGGGTDNETSQRDGGRESETEGDIRCICDFTDDDGFTIQCEQCLVWQHMDCVGVDDENVPEDYFCEKCRPRPVNSEAANRLQRKKRLKQVRRKSSSFRGTNGNPALNGDDLRETDVNSKMTQDIENPLTGYDDEDSEERSRHPRHHDIHVDSNSEESSSELNLSRKANELRSLKRRGRPPSMSSSSIVAHMELAHENSRKLSREERKLQQLMETFNRLEDREKKKAKRHHEGDSSRSSLLLGEYHSSHMRFLHDRQDNHSSDESLSEGASTTLPTLHRGRRSHGHTNQSSNINRDSYGGGSVTPNARRRSNASFSRRNRLSHMSLYALKGRKAWLLHSSRKSSSAMSPLIPSKRMIIVKLEAKDSASQIHKEEAYQDLSSRSCNGNPEFLDSTTNIDVVGIGSPTEPQMHSFPTKIPHSPQQDSGIFLKQEIPNLHGATPNSMDAMNSECFELDSHVTSQLSVDEYSQQTSLLNRDEAPFSSENHEHNLPLLDENRMAMLPITKKVSLSDYRKKKQTTGSLDTEMSSLAQI